MTPDATRLLATLTAELEAISREQHALGRRKELLREMATRLRVGTPVIVVAAMLEAGMEERDTSQAEELLGAVNVAGVDGRWERVINLMRAMRSNREGPGERIPHVVGSWPTTAPVARESGRPFPQMARCRCARCGVDGHAGP